MPTKAKRAKVINSKEGKKILSKIYGDNKRVLEYQQTRYASLIDKYRSNFGETSDLRIFSSPGRTELGGNHTDHENGRVIAAAIDLDTVALVARNHSDDIRIVSEGFASIELRIDKPKSDAATPSALLVKGICQYYRDRGYELGGFNSVMTSCIPIGSGLSSSASFEMITALILNNLFNHGSLGNLELALAGQYAEIHYYGKPCGLMDQLTCALGGIQVIDFKDAQQPVSRSVKNTLADSGYSLIVTDTGGSHAHLTEDYKAIKEENHAIAQFFNKSVLREVNRDAFNMKIPYLRQAAGDRAILRAIHFFDENDRVEKQVEALERADYDNFFNLVKTSGLSSWKYLQNYYSSKDPGIQGIPLGMALSEQVLGEEGASRIHGGGFAGSIQAYVPNTLVTEYRNQMERMFGLGACMHVMIREKGALELTEFECTN